MTDDKKIKELAGLVARLAGLVARALSESDDADAYYDAIAIVRNAETIKEEN